MLFGIFLALLILNYRLLWAKIIYMKSTSFTFHGKEYQVEKVIELEPKAGKRHIHVITKDNKRFKLTFQESIFKWVVTEST
jgi:hypothetical protein